jgi:hypothetical protein
MFKWEVIYGIRVWINSEKLEKSRPNYSSAGVRDASQPRAKIYASDLSDMSQDQAERKQVHNESESRTNRSKSMRRLELVTTC